MMSFYSNIINEIVDNVVDISDKKNKQREKTRIYKRKYRQRPDVKNKRKAYNQKTENKERSKARRKEKAYHKRPEVKAARKEKAYHKRPEVKAARKEYDTRPEVKAARKTQRQKPEVKAAQKTQRQRPEHKEKMRFYYVKRYQTDSKFKLTRLLRARLYISLKSQNAKKFHKTMALLGCSPAACLEHIESQFEEGMSWDNHGVHTADGPRNWHIDHIIPCASFDLEKEEQQKKCFHYSNLQPLWGLDNIKKGSTVLDF